jgi:hypothetical protein
MRGFRSSHNLFNISDSNVNLALDDGRIVLASTRASTTPRTSTARTATSPATTTNRLLALAVSTSPLTKATMSVVLSALTPHERALSVSGQACPHAESIILCVCVLTWALAREDFFALLGTFEPHCMDPPHLAS